MILRTTLNWKKILLNRLPKGRLSSSRLSSRHLLLAVFSIAIASTTLSSCAEWLPDAYKIDLQQGNSVKLEQLEQVEIGMSKTEVRKIMGSPMLADPFHNQRWDYIYRFVPRKGFERKSLLTLHFEDDILSSIDDSEYIEP